MYSTVSKISEPLDAFPTQCNQYFHQFFFFIKVFNNFILHSKDRDEDEEEDFNIKPDDNLLVAGHVDEDLSSLEISGDNCYCKKFPCVSSNFCLFFLLYILK